MFDGDEMNTHSSQSLQTMMELRDFAGVPNHMLTPKDGKPIITLIQDGLLGTYRLTKDHTRLDDKTFANLQMVNSFFRPTLPEPEDKETNTYTGQQAFSQILPPAIFLETKNGSDGKVLIENSKLTGTIDKGVYNTQTRGILHSIYKDYGPDDARRFIDNASRTICRWLLQSGFSVGISDLVLNEEMEKQLKNSIADMKRKVFDTLEKVRDGSFQNTSIYSNQDFFEAEVNSQLNKVIQTAGKLVRENMKDNTNRMINMIKAGSKGNEMNVSQMVVCVGQQNVDGKRINYGFSDRTLPHYTKYDDGPEARGFVENSFLTGLTPQETFFHAMGGREGLIDTAVKTSDTGYTQRKLVKAMEDCKIQYDFTVRNAQGAIVQFLYGEDGIEGTKVEQQQIPYLRDNMTIEQMRKNYLVEGFEEHFEDLVNDRKFLVETLFKGEYQTNIMYAIPFQRILTKTKKSMELDPNVPKTPLTAEYIMKNMKKLLKELYIAPQSPATSRFGEILIHAYLSPKPLLDMNLSREAFDWYVKEIQRHFKEAIACPGEMVGVVAAQSVGEICTQLTLNSVEWNTPLLVRKNGELFKIKIGEWIDTIVKNAKETDIEKHPNDTLLVHLRENDGVWDVPSCDELGNVMWKRIEAVTRHPPINKDGSSTLLHVTTQSGREVIATKGKSFLKKINNKIVQINGDELKVGDYLPVSKTLDVGSTLMYLDLKTFLPPTEFVYGHEVQKALEAKASGDRFWWSSNIGKKFILPFKRGDTFYEAYNGIRGEALSEDEIKGVWCLKRRSLQSASLPHEIPLDEEFGFVCGAYLAEGNCTPHAMMISNNDELYLNKIRQWLSKYSINEYTQVFKKNGGTSTNLRATSTVLAQLMQRMFGTGSAQKRIPPIFFNASEAFWRGLFDGYFSGDGYLPKRNVYVTATSISRCLLDDIQQGLAKFNIKSSITYTGDNAYKSASKKFKTVHKAYILKIQGDDNLEQFSRIVTLTVTKKQNQLLQHVARAKLSRRLYSPGHVIPDIITQKLGHKVTMTTDDVLRELKNDTLTQEDRVILEQALHSDVFYDKVVSIEEVVSNYPYVYDLTVEDTRNFNLYSGLAQADTFHYAGISSSANVTRGVPRLKEVLNVTKNIKNPSIAIHLKDELSTDEEKAKDIMRSLEITRLQDLVTMSEICYDPAGEDGYETGIDEDKGFLQVYRRFHEFDDQHESDRPRSPWVLRLKLDHAKLLQHNLTMMDIYQKINNQYYDRAECIFTDDNSKDLIFRIRLQETEEIGVNDMVTALKALENNLLHSMLLKGVNGIKKTMLRKATKNLYDPATDTFQQRTFYIVDTDGTNLQEILANPNINSYKTISNDIVEVYETLGIEAARNCLYNEIQEVMSSSSVNYRHLSLLIDVMTNRGTLMSIDRHGLNRGDTGPFTKSSFEESTDILINAGIFAEKDPISGVSPSIILGQLAPCGTGASDIILDEQMLTGDFEETTKASPFFQETVIEKEEPMDCQVPQSGVYSYTIPKSQDGINALPAVPEIKLV